jgi:hypothetical protein
MQFARTPLEIAGRIQTTSISLPNLVREHTEESEEACPSRTKKSSLLNRRYELTDQAALFFGSAFYTYHSAWFVNMFRNRLLHNLRCYYTFPIRGGKNGRIDPIRLQIAVGK